VVPTTDPEVGQMIEFRDLLRRDSAAREAYAADKRRIATDTADTLDYTEAKTRLIRYLLPGQGGEPSQTAAPRGTYGVIMLLTGANAVRWSRRCATSASWRQGA